MLRRAALVLTLVAALVLAGAGAAGAHGPAPALSAAAPVPPPPALSLTAPAPAARHPPLPPPPLRRDQPATARIPVRARPGAGGARPGRRARPRPRGQALLPGDARDRRPVRLRRAVAADDPAPPRAGHGRQAADDGDGFLRRLLEAPDARPRALPRRDGQDAGPHPGTSVTGFDNLAVRVKYTFFGSHPTGML